MEVSCHSAFHFNQLKVVFWIDSLNVFISHLYPNQAQTPRGVAKLSVNLTYLYLAFEAYFLAKI